MYSSVGRTRAQAIWPYRFSGYGCIDKQQPTRKSMFVYIYCPRNYGEKRPECLRVVFILQLEPKFLEFRTLPWAGDQILSASTDCELKLLTTATFLSPISLLLPSLQLPFSSLQSFECIHWGLEAWAAYNWFNLSIIKWNQIEINKSWKFSEVGSDYCSFAQRNGLKSHALAWVRSSLVVALNVIFFSEENKIATKQRRPRALAYLLHKGIEV